MLGVLLASLFLSTHAQAEHRQTAPAFSLEVLQGQPHASLESLRGSVVVIEFWATYCGWCKQTHPKLAAFAAEHPEVHVLAISAQKRSRLLRYLRKHNTQLTVLHDPRAKVSRSYRVNVTPTLVVIGKHGKVWAWAEGGNSLDAVLRVATQQL